MRQKCKLSSSQVEKRYENFAKISNFPRSLFPKNKGSFITICQSMDSITNNVKLSSVKDNTCGKEVLVRRNDKVFDSHMRAQCAL